MERDHPSPTNITRFAAGKGMVGKSPVGNGVSNTSMYSEAKSVGSGNFGLCYKSSQIVAWPCTPMAGKLPTKYCHQ